jgi:exopolysaccharide production protein ExoZ
VLKNLQVMRAIAAVLVVIHHFLLANRDFGQAGGIAGFHNLAELGACGVDLFFCISGFVMLSSIARKPGFSAFDFAVGRISRIYPAYWVMLTVFILLVGLNHVKKTGLGGTLAEPLFSAGFLLSSYLLLPAYNPESGFMQPFLAQGWTLSYELYFYALLMIAAVAAKANALRTALLGGFLLVTGVVLFKDSAYVGGIFVSNTIVLEFILGMLVFLLVQKTKRLGWLAIVTGFCLLAATVFFKVENRVLFWGVPAALVLYGFVALEGSLSPWKILKSLGDASYSLYLTHGALTYIYGGLLKRGWYASPTKQNLAVVIGTAFAILLAFVFYRFVEKPMVAKFNHRRLRSQSASVA